MGRLPRRASVETEYGRFFVGDSVLVAKGPSYAKLMVIQSLSRSGKSAVCAPACIRVGVDLVHEATGLCVERVERLVPCSTDEFVAGGDLVAEKTRRSWGAGLVVLGVDWGRPPL